MISSTWRVRCTAILATMAIGGVAAVGAAQPTPAAAATAYPYTLSSDKLKIGFAADGSIQSLKINNDLFDTQYVMNPDVAPDQGNETNAKYKQWLGNVMFSYANGDGAVSATGVGSQKWKKAWTTESADGRTVTSDGNSVTVTYQNSTDAEGIKGFTLTEKYSIATDGSLTWSQTATNTSKTKLTIGDWGIPVPANELWKQGDAIYETRVLTHSHIGKNSSYLTMQRPSGQGPSLVLSTDSATNSGFEYQDRWRTEEVGDTSWAWNAGNEGSNVKGLNVYYPHSMAIQKTNRGYLPSTSLAIAAGASKTYTFHIAKADDEQGVKDTLYNQGSVDSTVVPGMVVPYDQAAQLAIRVKGSISKIATKNNNDLGGAAPTNPKVALSRTNGDYKIYTLKFDKTQLGTNNVTVTYLDANGASRQTVLQFYVIDKVADLLDQHAQFMVDHTQWTAKDNLAADDIRNYTFDDWMMNAADGSVPDEDTAPQGRRNAYFGYFGLGDDWGLPHGEFLAEKLVDLPEKKQVEALNLYLEKAVWQNLMGNTDDAKAPSYLVYDFWEQGKPGALNTTPSYRGYAYPHIYNTFYSMYKIEKQNPDLITYSRSAKWYLNTAYQVFKELYDGPVAYNYFTGLMGELTTPELIASLRAEGMNAEANDIESKMATKYTNFRSNTYPYGSEYSYDNTGEEAVYTLAKSNVNTDETNALRMMRDIVLKTRAARGQNPVWFQYSDPVTITGENWWQFQYSASLAGYTMDDYINHTSALETGDNAVSSEQRAVLQRLNYAGKTNGLSAINSGQISNVAANIGASAWTYQAEKGNLGTLGTGGGSNVQLLNGWRGMTGESDLSLWGILQSLSADVVTDDPIFGTVGYGAKVTATSDQVTVVPTDGLGRRLNLTTQQLSVDLNSDKLTKAIATTDNAKLTLGLTNVTGAAHTGSIDVSGLAQGTYQVRVSGVKTSKINVYVPAAKADQLQAPTTVTFPVPAGSTYTLALAPTTPDANKAPTVNAGTDQTGLTLGLDPITLSGSASDDNLGKPNGTLNLKWSTSSVPTGGAATFSSATSKSPTVTVTKAGTYVFKLTASDGALSASDTVSVTVKDVEALPANWVQYNFDSSSNSVVPDQSGNGNDLTLKGNATTTTDGSDTVLKLDGSDGTYAQLPDGILSRATAYTVSMRVKVNSYGFFTRILDFGSNTNKYLFLTPKMGNGFTGIGVSTSGNGNESQILTSYTFPTATWVDVKMTFKPNSDGTTTGTLYADGTQIGQNTTMAVAAKDLGKTTGNYLGKSQFPDPYAAVSFDSFQIKGTVE